MNRSWMNSSRISDVYENDVENFLQFTQQNGKNIHENWVFYISYFIFCSIVSLQLTKFIMNGHNIFYELEIYDIELCVMLSYYLTI